MLSENHTQNMDHKESDPVTVESVNSPRSASPVEKSKDVDDALVFVKEQGSIDWTEGEESKLVRKLDMWLMPLVGLKVCERCLY